MTPFPGQVRHRRTRDPTEEELEEFLPRPPEFLSRVPQNSYGPKFHPTSPINPLSLIRYTRVSACSLISVNMRSGWMMRIGRILHPDVSFPRIFPFPVFCLNRERKEKSEKKKKKKKQGRRRAARRTRRDALTLESRSVGETRGGSQYKRVQRDPGV